MTEEGAMKKIVVVMILLASMSVSTVLIIRALRKPSPISGERRELVGVPYEDLLNRDVVTRRFGGQNQRQTELRSKVSRVRTDMRWMATALECYYVDNNAYPPWEMSNLYQPPQPIIRNRYAETGVLSLTTPIAYAPHMAQDQFGNSSLGWFTYYSDKNGWILISPGPDGDYDIDPVHEYNGSAPQPSARLLVKSYDPTNGLDSSGDIFRVKQMQ
jgi:hypothetical protein